MDSSREISRDHPAIIACEELGIRRFESARLDLLKRGVCGSSVFRLRDEAGRAAPIIAKYCPSATGEVERRVYEDILGGDVAAAPYYGWLAANEDGFCWIFLGEVGGTRYSPGRAEHRRAAGRWLAALHSALRLVEEPADFPKRSPDHYRNLLGLVDTRLTDAAVEVESSQHEHSLLEALRLQLDRIASGWGAIETVCDRMPRSLVHGDLVTHNAYLRQEAAGLALIPIDWEKAGWGTPAEDLSEIDLDAYEAMMAPQSARPRREHYVQLARVGRVFRCLVFLEWVMPGNDAPLDERVWANLELCRSWLDDLA
jgi:hypothetical protein